jgi:branched-chain amino acid transport system permease protein
MRSGGEGQRWGLRRLALAILLSILALVGLGATVTAQGTSPAAPGQEETEPQSIGGRVQNRYIEDGERITEGVPDVRIVVETEGGEPVAEGVTDENGQYRIGVPEPGTFVIRIDQDSLPEDLTVEEGGGETTATVSANQNVTRAFFLGEDTRDIKGAWSRLPQTIANGLKLSMIIAITSVGLSLIFGTTGLSNFAHGEMVTFGAFIAFFVNSDMGWHVIPATLISVGISALVGMGLERVLWRPLRNRKISLTSMMIVSIGVALAARYLILYVFGGDQRSYRQYTLQPNQVDIGPVSLSPRSLWVMGISIIVLVGVAFFLLKTRFGKAIRAVSDNPDLASSTGIDTNRVIITVWAIAGALAGLGGVLYGLEYQIRWDMGFTLLLLMFAAITLGGLGNPFGALLGSVVIGLFVELWTWVVPNANDLKTVGALIGLIVILIIRPQGLLGTKERIG